MTQIEWENIFLENLKPLKAEERYQIAEYYREIYGDKLEAGLSSDEILAEFGSPQECAQKILSEGGGETLVAAKKENETEQADQKQARAKNKTAWTPAMITGMVFLTLLLILPLAVVALGVAVVFAAGCIGGGAMTIGGAVYVVASPFMALSGVGFGAIVAHIGLGLAVIGLGALLFVGFYYLEKYVVLGCYKALRWIYKRGE